MNRTKSSLYLCVIGSALLTLTGIILRSVAVTLCFDKSTGYFEPSALSLVCQIISTLAVLFPTVTSILIPRQKLSAVWQGQAISFAAILPGIALTAFAVYRLLVCGLYAETTALPYALSLFALGAGVYFLLSPIFRTQKPRPVLHCTLGLFTVFWVLASVADTYFDLFTTMNSPIKTIVQFGLLSAALMCLTELRFMLGKGLPRMGVCVHCLAMHFCLVAGISALSAAIADTGISTAYLMYGVVLLAIGLYASIRLFVYVTATASHVISPSQEDHAS